MSNNKVILSNKKVYLQYMDQIEAKNASIKDILTRVINESTLHKNTKQALIQDLIDIETLGVWAAKLKNSLSGL